MAEPVEYGKVPMRVGREFSVSRLEQHLLSKVFELLVPAARNRCPLALSSAPGVRSPRVRGAVCRKGV
jgi:hypothetical protein